MTETAIFSQWQHSKTTELYYARWKTGEIDIVHLHNVSQLLSWIVEVKWSDRPYRILAELDNCAEFVNLNFVHLVSMLIFWELISCLIFRLCDHPSNQHQQSAIA